MLYLWSQTEYDDGIRNATPGIFNMQGFAI